MDTSIGMFTVSPRGNIKSANTWIVELLQFDPLQHSGNIPYQDFLTRLVSFSLDPARSQAAIDIGVENVNDYPVINLNIAVEYVRHIQLYLFPGDAGESFAWGGLVIDRTIERSGFLQQLQIRDHRCI